jgi:hypothetical protein
VVLALGITVLSDTALVIWQHGRVENSNALAQVLIAEDLRKMGVGPREAVAVIGDGEYAYWAHLAGLRIVAEVPRNAEWKGGRDSTAAFWASPAIRQDFSQSWNTPRLAPRSAAHLMALLRLDGIP